MLRDSQRSLGTAQGEGQRRDHQQQKRDAIEKEIKCQSGGEKGSIIREEF